MPSYLKDKREILVRLRRMEGQIADVESKLGKLYDTLETREFKTSDLTPRVRALTQKKGVS